MGSFVKIRKFMSFKFTKDLGAMKLKNDARIEEEFTCPFKIGKRNLTNFDRSTQKFQKFAF